MSVEHKATGKPRNFAIKTAKSAVLARHRVSHLRQKIDPVVGHKLFEQYVSDLLQFFPDALDNVCASTATVRGRREVRFNPFQLSQKSIENLLAVSTLRSLKSFHPEHFPMVSVQWPCGLGDVVTGATETAVKEWAKFLPLFIQSMAEGKEEALSRAATAYKPQVTLAPVDLERLEMQKNAAEAILSGTEWLIASDIARLLNRSKSNPNALANRWKNEGKVFAIRYDGAERYPRYAFDDRLEPRPVIAEVVKSFGENADPWRIAAWFESANAWLDSKRPREMLDQPQRVIAAARQRKGWAHG